VASSILGHASCFLKIFFFNCFPTFGIKRKWMIQAFCDIFLHLLHYKDPVKEKSDKSYENNFEEGMPRTGFDPIEQE